MTAKYENQKFRQGFTHVIGCDEVGRGCLAGPVVAAAVILPRVESGKLKVKSFGDINDSKLLQPKKREELSEVIKQNCVAWGIGLVEHSIIDEINIHHASLQAMRMAVEELLESWERRGASFPRRGKVASDSLTEGLEHYQQNSNRLPALTAGLLLEKEERLRSDALVALDGRFTIPDFHMQQEAIVDGDAKILSIAAASIIAKVYRDSLMQTFDKQYPRYKFGQHKGYATAVHRKAITDHGLTPIHRISFCSNFV